MKCEKCGNEAMFHYQSEINGEKSEYHLCADCAKAEGFGELLDFKPRSMFDGFFGEPFFARPMSLMDSFFESPFGLLSDGFFGSRMLAPTLSLPRVMVKVDEDGCKGECSPKSTETAEKMSHNIPRNAGEELQAKRRLHQLKHELKCAIHSEEFEKAAELRDKIRELEK